MSRLDRLRKSLLEMHPEELRERVRSIRRERRIVRDRPATKVAKKKESTRAKDQLSKLLAELTPEQRQKLLGAIGHSHASDEGHPSDLDHSEGSSPD